MRTVMLMVAGLVATACTSVDAEPSRETGEVEPSASGFQCDFDSHDGRVAGLVQVDAEGSQGGIGGIPVSIVQESVHQLISADSHGRFEADLAPGWVSVWVGREPGAATWRGPYELEQESTTCHEVMATTCALNGMVFTTTQFCTHDD